MEEAFLEYLVATGSPVLARLPAASVSWGLNAQATPLPRIALTKVGGTPVSADDGDSGLKETRVQVDCFASSFLGATQVARSVEERLSGISVTTGGIEFQGIYLDSERSDVDRDDTGETHLISLDLMVWHRSA